MADIVFITPCLAVASQFEAADFERAAAMGFKSVINNRPDEEKGLPIDSKAGEALARRAGLAYAYQPVLPHNLLDEDVIDAFEDALAGMPGPVLAYCRTGNRSSILWAFAAARRAPTDEVLRAMGEIGVDIGFLESELREQSAAAPQASPGRQDRNLVLAARPC